MYQLVLFFTVYYCLFPNLCVYICSV